MCTPHIQLIWNDIYDSWTCFLNLLFFFYSIFLFITFILLLIISFATLLKIQFSFQVFGKIIYSLHIVFCSFKICFLISLILHYLWFCVWLQGMTGPPGKNGFPVLQLKIKTNMILLLSSHKFFASYSVHLLLMIHINTNHTCSLCTFYMHYLTIFMYIPPTIHLGSNWDPKMEKIT